MQQVLQVSAKLSEGGAAGVARSLSDELRSIGIRSPFVYGYGRRGLSSHLESSYDGIRITPGAVAAINRTSYGFTGAETKLRSRRNWRRFVQAVSESDVVHLHILHSYFADLQQIIEILSDAGKPVVWTLHDQWLMTGRCAQPAGCTLWATGCTKCPDLAAYPPARIDHAAERWIERRALIKELQENTETEIVACADWLAQHARTAGFDNVSTITNSVDREFWEVASSTVRSSSTHTRNLFICRDLRDNKKVSVNTLNHIASSKGQKLTVMGDQPPPDLKFSTHLAATGDRAEIARTMKLHDRLIFTSDVDYYPLTIAEALTAGLEVFALDSPAAREFRNHNLVRIFPNLVELAIHTSDAAIDAPPVYSPPDCFDPKQMVKAYLALYQSMIDRSAK